MVSQSSNCWSKWRVSSRTVFSSSRALLLQRALPELADHCDGADDDRDDEQAAATDQPDDRVTAPRAAIRRDTVIATWDILFRRLESNSRTSHSQGGHAYDAARHKRLANQVTGI